MKKYDIAAYVWPAYTGDEIRTRIFWPEGIGEWQSVKNSEPKDNGYFWNRKPLWGYVNEADPYVMEMEIEAAVNHGVNVFIYDWYWYDNRPFLENCLNEGFLKASNRDKMKFYLMWANHDVGYTWDKRISSGEDTVIWQGTVNEEQFRNIAARWIEKYMMLPNYYCIDGRPVISIYDLNNFVNSFGGMENTKKNILWLQEEAVRHGLPGIHLQFIKWGEDNQNLSGVDGNITNVDVELVESLGFMSLTNYQFVHFTDVTAGYETAMEQAAECYERYAEEYKIPYYPHVSIGWDNNPRFTKFKPPVMEGVNPENFKKALNNAKKYADEHDINLITINSWNEWTETSYLEPDNLFGYGYLEAVKEVFGV